MQMAADPPQKLLAAAEQPVFGTRKHAGAHKISRFPQPVDIFGDPKQGVEIPEAAFSVFDIWLDEIARAARLSDAAIAFGKFGRDELSRGPLHDLALEPGPHVLEKRPVPEDHAGFEERGADRHVVARLSEAFLDRAGRMADFLTEIPQHIEDRLGDPFAALTRRAGEEKQKIDVRSR